VRFTRQAHKYNVLHRDKFTPQDNSLRKKVPLQMNVLLLSAVFPPNVIGGAEISASNLAQALTKRGHNVAVLTMAEPSEPQVWDQPNENGVRMFRLHYPRRRTTYDANIHPLKPMEWKIWHLQDYLDPRPLWNFRKIINLIRPDFVNIHLLDGLGFNLLPLIASKGIPTGFFLHDLSLICTLSSMFKDGKNCAQQCGKCHAVGLLKRAFMARAKNVIFVSPSKANLDRIKLYLPLASERPSFIIPNIPDFLPILPAFRADPSGIIRLLFAGRITAAKGLHVLLEALRPLATRYSFHLTILGRGDQEAELKSTFGREPWVTFAGHQERKRVLEYASQMDAMVVPSIWGENWSGSVVQALRLGLPVIGSETGGIPEQVRNRVTGLLLPPGKVKAWCDGLESVLSDPSQLSDWRENTKKYFDDFDEPTIFKKYEEMFTNQISLSQHR
jgi:glycosyltransferase involved in cell wall biosynthesis